MRIVGHSIVGHSIVGRSIVGHSIVGHKINPPPLIIITLHNVC